MLLRSQRWVLGRLPKRVSVDGQRVAFHHVGTLQRLLLDCGQRGRGLQARSGHSMHDIRGAAQRNQHPQARRAPSKRDPKKGRQAGGITRRCEGWHVGRKWGRRAARAGFHNNAEVAPYLHHVEREMVGHLELPHCPHDVVRHRPAPGTLAAQHERGVYTRSSRRAGTQVKTRACSRSGGEGSSGREPNDRGWDRQRAQPGFYFWQCSENHRIIFRIVASFHYHQSCSHYDNDHDRPY